MNKILANVELKFPCRTNIINELLHLLYVRTENDPLPSAIYLYGLSGTAKTAIITELLRQCLADKIWQKSKINTVHLNCIECYTSRLLFEHILSALFDGSSSTSNNSNLSQIYKRCDNLCDFIQILRRCRSLGMQGCIIVLDNAERLRDMDENVLSTLLCLRKLTGLNGCVVLLSQLPFEKYYPTSGLTKVTTIHCPPYTKLETQQILSADRDKLQKQLYAQWERKRSEAKDAKERADLQRKCKLINEIVTVDFFNNYLNAFLGVFYKACRDLPELKFTAHKYFAVYLEPVLNGSVAATDVLKLWQHISKPLSNALSHIYMRLDKVENNKELSSTDTACGDVQQMRTLAQCLELPYYTKFLIIAAFLASYNSAKEDKRLFVKNHGKQRKRLQTVNSKAKTAEKKQTSIGPQAFTIDRLLAIFYAILDEKVALTCNLLSQISTLVHLKLLSFVSGEDSIMDANGRLQCMINLHDAVYIGRVVGFNVRQYLCDFA